MEQHELEALNKLTNMEIWKTVEEILKKHMDSLRDITQVNETDPETYMQLVLARREAYLILLQFLGEMGAYKQEARPAPIYRYE